MSAPMISVSASITAGCILLSACASNPVPPAAWSAIHPGMMKGEVRSQLGEPEAILPQPIEPPQDPDGWCLTLSLWKIEGPIERWVYHSGEHSLVVDFDYAGRVMDGG